MERFTHFIQEANKRGLDLKKYAPMMRALGEDFRAGKPPSIDISEIEAQSSKTNVFEVGKFYTNAYDENYRCTKVENGTATLIFMAVFQGKSLDMIVGVDQPKWKYYWPMVGQSKIEALEMRYQSLVSKNPSVAAFESSAIR